MVSTPRTRAREGAREPRELGDSREGADPQERCGSTSRDAAPKQEGVEEMAQPLSRLLAS